MSENVETLRQQVNSLKWYHQIDLGRGVITPGVDNTPKKLARLNLPARLDGKTVLDVGAWDGFFSFEAERRGAQRVLATDSYSWNGSNWGSKKGFQLAHRTLNSKVEDMDIDALNLSPEKVGTFDVVFFLGVLYHMRHPLLALEKVASVTRGCVIIETVSDFVWCRRPVIPFYLGSELNRDASNWCAPNTAGVIALLKAAGFAEVEVIQDVRSVFFRVAKAAYYKFKGYSTFLSLARTDRIVVHAWKEGARERRS